MKAKYLPVCLLLLLSIQFAHAQTPSSESRPTVGLVLSGGGARGIAEIGVIEWFEEHRIPVDYVAGTSMGGLIGGLYAMGWSPAEMRALIESVDWARTFGVGISYDERTFRRKEDRRQYPADIEVGLKQGKLSLPPGLSNGHHIGLIIDRATLPYYNLKSFDDLPIPFRCVGADLIHAKEIVLQDGSLSSAMRATMSIPGVFPPVHREGLWLIDGGVFDNAPTDVMKSLGPKVIIAVNVGTPLGDEKSISSFIGVMGQTIGILTSGSEKQYLQLADLVITPDLKNKSNLDFSHIDQTAKLGYTASEKNRAVLEKYALDEAAWKEHLAQRKARRKIELPVPGDVQVTGVEPSAADGIRKELKAFIGKPLQPAELEVEINKLVGDGRHQNINYGFAEDASGQSVLQIRVVQKTYSPPSLDFALGISGTDISDLIFSAGSRMTLFDIGSYGSEWRIDLNVGLDSNFGTEFYRPFGSGRLFVAPRASYSRNNESLFLQNVRLAEFKVNRYSVGGDFGLAFYNAELRLGYEIGRVSADVSTGAFPQDSLSGREDFARLRYALDSSNSATIATKGLRLESEARYYFHSPEASAEFPQPASEFPQATVHAIWYQPLSKKDTIFVSGSVGTTFDKDAAPAQAFTLGGLFKLSAYDQNEFFGNHSTLLQGGYYHQIGKLSPLMGGGVWVVGFVEAGSAFNDFSDQDYHGDGAVGVVMDTKLGPFGIIGSWGESGKSNIYFSFGKFF